MVRHPDTGMTYSVIILHVSVITWTWVIIGFICRISNHYWTVEANLVLYCPCFRKYTGKHALSQKQARIHYSVCVCMSTTSQPHLWLDSVQDSTVPFTTLRRRESAEEYQLHRGSDLFSGLGKPRFKALCKGWINTHCRLPIETTTD